MMLYMLKELFTPNEILEGNFGVEREGLRCNKDGSLSDISHPKVFGGKLSNPYITTDFSESQVEVITPTFNTVEETYKFLNSLYDIVALEIGDEYIWPQSMPCDIPQDNDIPIAEFCKCSDGEKARIYREKLLKKYGGKKQLISGIHYNFSFNDIIIEKLYDNSNKEISYKEFKDSIYLKIVRNYLRYRWLIVYLLGGTAILHASYAGECIKGLDEVTTDSFSNTGAISYRNSECGYRNNEDLFPNYKNVQEYVNSINNFINDGLIENYKELYSQIRLKAKDSNNLLDSLISDGINYLEIRSIDINPFERAGISLEDLKFVHLFNLFLLIEDESNYEEYQQEATENQKLIAKYGQNDILLSRNGEKISSRQWSLEILNKIRMINVELNLGQENIVDLVEERVKNSELTYGYRILNKVKEEGYINAHINLAKEYKREAYNNRYKLEGFEDLELSTQILMKEAIKRGIKVNIIDRKDNFISLKKKNKVEYVKQATKTSKDNYMSVLMMENKLVTKKILEEHNIKIPKGIEFSCKEEAVKNLKYYINNKMVVKPKSTNFGNGISIFPNGANNIKDIEEAMQIAFSYDDTILIEEFIPGKEYRFLVINEEVVGILHRVPANVIGDGEHTIRELVNEKNKSPLRGKGYVTPLEKINLDESARLFLAQRSIDFDYVPNGNELVYLRENSNISTGGDSIDYTDEISDKFKKIAVEAAKAVDAKICGVDMMIEDYKNEDSSYSIIELNFNPAIHIHSYPYKGKERSIAKHILDLLGFIGKKDEIEC